MRKKAATRLKVVLYARVSSKEQEAEGFSVDAQLRLLRAYAAEQGVDVAREFVEAETAKVAGRKAFGEMLRFLESRPGHAILVEKVDRLYRNFADYVKVDGLGVELHFVKEGMVVSESSKSQDKFMHGIRVLMAKNYVDNLSEEIRKGMDEKAAQGIYPTKAPLGYLNALEPGTKRKVIVPDPSRAHLVKELFQEYASSRHTIDTLMRHAVKIGLTTKKGHRLARSAVSQLLKHPAYCGIVRWNGRDTAGVHEPLISHEVWKRCQDVMEGRGSSNAGWGGAAFAYRGLLRCACGETMSGELKKGRYVYYHCTGRKRELCGRPYVSEKAITNSFAEILSTLHVPDELLGWIKEGLRAADKDRLQRREAREKAIAGEVRTLKGRLESLYLDKLSGEVSAEFYRETRDRWESRVTELQLELAALDRAEGTAVDDAMRVLELAATAADRFKRADSDQMNELVKYMCSNCSWEGGRLVVELHEVFDLMLNALESEAKNKNEASEEHPVLTISEEWWRIGDSNP